MVVTKRDVTGFVPKADVEKGDVSLVLAGK